MQSGIEMSTDIAKDSLGSHNTPESAHKSGLKKFHYFLVLVCGLVYFSCGYQSGLSSYVIPVAQCDLQMSSEDKGRLKAIFLSGGIVSGLMWGMLADSLGRRKIIVSALILDSIITFFSCFSQSFGVFVTFRFFNGFVLMAPGSLIYTYLGEIIEEKHRGTCLCFLGVFYNLSWMLLPAVAMGVLSLQFHMEVFGFNFNSWRLYYLLAIIPKLTSALLLAIFFPESPKFLFSQGNETEALNILESIYGSNNCEAVRNILKDKVVFTTEEPEELAPVTSFTNEKSGKAVFCRLWNRSTVLLRPDIIGATTLASTILFCSRFSYSGLGLWLPELFDRFALHYQTSNESLTICELTYSVVGGSLHDTLTVPLPDPLDEACTGHVGFAAGYMNTLIIGTVCIFANVLCSLLANKLGLKVLSVATLLISGICVLAIYFVRTSTFTSYENMIVACTFLAFSEVGTVVVSSVICDLFPTKIRGLGTSVAVLVGRTGAVLSNIILGYLLESHCEVPLFLMAGFPIFGGLVSFALPAAAAVPSQSKENQNTLEDSEKSTRV